jgi:hypothetical protein
MSLLLYMTGGSFMLYSIVMIYGHKPSRGVTYANHISWFIELFKNSNSTSI